MRKITSIFFLILCVTFSMAQDVVKVQYERISKTSSVQVSGNIDNLPEDVKKQLLESSKNSKSLYTLYYTEGDSFFGDLSKKEEKEIFVKTTTSDTENKSVISSTVQRTIPFELYHKKGEKGNYVYRNIFDEEYYEYTEPNWKSVEYTNESEKIDNFECKLVKITDSNNEVFKVWYTEQIPISAGPFVFYSLPGLVLKVDAPRYTIYATAVSTDVEKTDMKYPNPKLKIYRDTELEKKKQEFSQPKVIKKEIRM